MEQFKSTGFKHFFTKSVTHVGELNVTYVGDRTICRHSVPKQEKIHLILPGSRTKPKGLAYHSPGRQAWGQPTTTIEPCKGDIII
jgi:hypothetical protein